MALNAERMYERVLASDPAFNGRFYTGVLTTGIYCLPSCKARKPKFENVKFFASERDAVAFGLRPCKKCRPDEFGMHLEEKRIEEVLSEVRENPGAFASIESLGERLGCGTSKLSELTRRYYHTTPAALLQRARIAYAQARLLDSEEPIGEVALDSGFESLSAFYENFKRAVGLTPQEFRNLRQAKCFSVVTPQGFQPERFRHHFLRDTESISEREDGTGFLCAVSLDGEPSLLKLEFDASKVECSLMIGKGSLLAHRWLVRKLGLAQDVRGFEALAEEDPLAGRLVPGGKAQRIPQTGNVWEGILWAIVGQQVNLKFASVLKRRLTELAGTSIGEGLFCLPTKEQVAKLDSRQLLPLQFSARKAEYLIEAARSDLPFELMPKMPATSVERMLMQMRGLGAWSTHYIMMRACSFGDCVPLGDTGLKSGLQKLFGLDVRPGAVETESLMRRFAPHRSLATYHIWNTPLEAQ